MDIVLRQGIHMTYANKILFFTISILLVCFNTGCRIASPGENNPLLNHQCPMVRYPAITGYYTGVIVGTPLEIPYIPIYILLRNNNMIQIQGEGWDEWYKILAPMIFTGTTTEVVFSGPNWMLFGWWWPDKNSIPPTVPNEYHTGVPLPEQQRHDTPSEAHD